LRQARIAVYDANFSPVDLDGRAFRDPLVPRDFAPFNVQNIGNNLYVTFAQQNAAKNFVNSGPGLGFVDVFSPKGELIMRFDHVNGLNAPFGLTLAPTDFGSFSHKLIVGQFGTGINQGKGGLFGSGELLAFDALTGKFEGNLVDQNNSVITIPGLWGISFGAGQPTPQASGPGNLLFFKVGINPEDDYPLDSSLRGGGFGWHGYAYARYRHMTLTDELRRNTIDLIDRYRDAYARERSRTRYDHFGDADQTAGTVEQRTAGISRIERDICLDSAGDFMPLGRRYCPAQSADDPRG
jgi:hypothetical protein